MCEIDFCSKGFDWERLHTGLASSEPSQTPLKASDLLPSSIPTFEAFRAASQRNQELLDLRVVHIQDVHGLYKIARTRMLHVEASKPDVHGRFFASMKERKDSDRDLFVALDDHIGKIEEAVAEQRAGGGQFQALPHLYGFPAVSDSQLDGVASESTSPS